MIVKRFKSKDKLVRKRSYLVVAKYYEINILYQKNTKIKIIFLKQ